MWKNLRVIAKRVHFFTAMIVLSFAMVHIINHFMIFWGAQAHIAFMEKLRNIYHHPIIWRILLYSVILQIMTGILNLRARNFRSPQMSVQLQSFSGFYLMLFLLIHIAAIHSARFVEKIETNLYFAVVGFRSFPEALFFYPYYFLAILSLFIHLACAWKHISSRRDWSLSAGLYNGVIASGIIIAVLLILALSGNIVSFDIL